MNIDDTIAAIATPIGEGGLAVIRISGSEAFAVGNRIFRSAKENPWSAPSHTIHYGHAVDGTTVLDEVLLSIFKAPRTFTREDVVEISCHGGILVTRRILETILKNGARLAEAGEFTKRAFLNGRLDLTQAEAVADLISARTDLALASANKQLEGKLSAHINAIRDDLMKVLAHVEAHIDFPEEDIAPDTHAALLQKIASALESIDKLLATANEGQILRHGIAIAIVGKPNAGKSSLLNQLLGKDRAIVSPIAGTTRDTIEETANIQGIPVVFTDTAGIRESADLIEAEGIRRSKASIANSQLILHVIDPSNPLTNSDTDLDAGGKKKIIVLNKSDLRWLATKLPEGIRVSCATGHGIEELKAAIANAVWAGHTAPKDHVPINLRHEEALRKAHEALDRAHGALSEGMSLEFVAMDLRIGVAAVGEVVGKTTTEDLLDAIFSQFCLGK